MILKVDYYEKDNTPENPHRNHIRMLDVYDFHIEHNREASSDETASHELVWHNINGQKGTLLLGHDKQNADHVYVMEKGKTADHMRFYAD